MKTLAEINFTEEDFAWLRKGLQALSKEDNMGSYLAEQYVANMPGLGISGRVQVKSMIEDHRRELKIKHEKMVDDLVMIQAKLIDFKKYLQQPAESLPADAKGFDPANEPAESKEPDAQTPVSAEG